LSITGDVSSEHCGNGTPRCDRAGCARRRAWDPELIESGLQVAASRIRYLEFLAPAVASTAQRLLGEPLELALLQGWASDRELADALEASWPRDVERG